MRGPRDRFEGENGQEVLVEALGRQPLLRGDATLAKSLAERGELISTARGHHLIDQGDWGTDLHFILAGKFDVLVNGQKMATRNAGEHVGELAGLSGSRPRTATLIAASESVTLKIDQSTLRELVGENAAFWRSAADIVAERLDERNLKVGFANEHPTAFVISSSEGLEVARHVRKELDCASLHVQLWNKGTFGISEYPISDLEDAIEASDYVIAVVRPDDTLISRGETSFSARDNVHLEYGIALGKLGRKRSVLLVDAAPELRLPSDLAGLTTARYRASTNAEMKRTVAKACDDIRDHIMQHGVRQDRRTR